MSDAQKKIIGTILEYIQWMIIVGIVLMRCLGY